MQWAAGNVGSTISTNDDIHNHLATPNVDDPTNVDDDYQ